MSKSTRFTQEDLDRLGLEEISPGVFGPKKKSLIEKASDHIEDITNAQMRIRGEIDNVKEKYDSVLDMPYPEIPPISGEGRMSNDFMPEKAKEYKGISEIKWTDQVSGNTESDFEMVMGIFVHGEDGKIKFKEDKDGNWVMWLPKDRDKESLENVNFIGGVDPASDEPGHSAVVKRLPAYIFLMVKGDPTPQQRHRHHQVKGADFVSTYDPSAKAKKAFLKQCLPYRPKRPYEQPLRVDMVFYFSRPKSHYRSGKYAHILKDTAPTLHVTRPDADNCAKFVKDSLNKTFWKDDSFVCDMNVKKRYDENPRTEITITPL